MAHFLQSIDGFKWMTFVEAVAQSPYGQFYTTSYARFEGVPPNSSTKAITSQR